MEIIIVIIIVTVSLDGLGGFKMFESFTSFGCFTLRIMKLKTKVKKKNIYVLLIRTCHFNYSWFGPLEKVQKCSKR